MMSTHLYALMVNLMFIIHVCKHNNPDGEVNLVIVGSTPPSGGARIYY